MIHEEDFKNNYYWKSCCFKVDPRTAFFFSQLFISIFVLFFCMIQLLISESDCGREQVYIGLITLIIGFWLPNPQIK